MVKRVDNKNATEPSFTLMSHSIDLILSKFLIKILIQKARRSETFTGMHNYQSFGPYCTDYYAQIPSTEQ